MEIHYMQQIKENPLLDGFKNEKMTIEEIQYIENRYNQGKQFPKAFREFLFLAGDFNNFAFDLIDGIEELQTYAKEEMEMAGQSVDRPYFAFDVLDSQYSVILLDEEEEDPTVYLLCPFLAKGGKEKLLRPNDWKFSDLVNEHIRRVKNDIPF